MHFSYMADFVTNKPFLPILQNWKFFANVNFVSLRVNSCEKINNSHSSNISQQTDYLRFTKY